MSHVATFSYENTSAERFQEFCQALLVPEFPGLQCLPVGQRDGGSDGLCVGETTTVLQVKWKRRDEDSQDVAKWAIKALKAELPKIQAMHQSGVSQYVLATNARGTSFPEVGSIAIVQKWLDENVPMPALCLWRDSLDRRFEANSTLQWHYPELLTGPGALRLAFESIKHGDVKKRSRAIQGFILKQYELEHEVRFKQIHLKNDLFPLFIDVPMSLQPRGRRAKSRHHELLHFAATKAHAGSEDSDELLSYYNSPAARSAHGGHLGSVELLLQCDLPDFKRIVIEGAPGQGKSTLGQYLCQIHRCRFLGYSQELDGLPERHKAGTARLPFRVELPHLSSWLEGRNPFPIHVQDGLPTGTEPSLESFLAYQVHHLSGSQPFSIDDLMDTLESCPTLLFLDGLDEVAGTTTRRRLISEVTSALSRFEQFGYDFQAVVTSRPAAFANSPGFSGSKFSYFTLNDVPPHLVISYGEKWIVAKELSERDAGDIRQILKERLSAPHIRDLARNPMQLAILLSLIYEVGNSLPDKRTDLYEQYLDKFMTREGEKTPAVKSRRRLIMRLHGYLAWILHCSSEAGQSSGSLSFDELQQLIREYLVENGHKVDALDEVFTGVVERVGVLVQRTEGRYEFEVQPLREFFAAEHLYSTAPQSSRRARRPGTISDRFATLTQNRYWTNVTRFYSGFYKSAELADLAVHVKSIKSRPKLISPIYVRQLGAMLLQDWVFEERPPVRDDVAQEILDLLGMRCLANNFAGPKRNLFITPSQVKGLQSECGGEILSEKVLEVLKERQFNTPFNNELGALLHSSGDHTVEQSLLEMASLFGGDPALIVELAMHGKLISCEKQGNWLEIAQRTERVSELISGICTSSDDLLDRSLSLPSLQPDFLFHGAMHPEAIINSVTSEHWIQPIAFALFSDTRRWHRRRRACEPPSWLRSDWPALHGLLQLANQLNETPMMSDHRPDLVRDWISTLQHMFPQDHWPAYRAAINYSFVDRKSPGNDQLHLAMDDKDFLALMLESPHNRRKTTWWLSMSEDISGREAALWLGLFITWYYGPLTEPLLRRTEELMESLSDAQFSLLYRALRSQSLRRERHRSHASATSSDRLALLYQLTMRRRFDVNARLASSKDSLVSQVAQTAAMSRLLVSPPTRAQWPLLLKRIAEAYSSHINVSVGFLDRSLEITDMPVQSALTVLAQPERYPFSILAMADQSLQKQRTVKGVAMIAAENGWTFGDPQM